MRPQICQTSPTDCRYEPGLTGLRRKDAQGQPLGRRSIGKKPESYDALLLDNTPDDLIPAGNARLYTPKFFEKPKKQITPEGGIAYWLSEPAPNFKKVLSTTGFSIDEQTARDGKNSKRSRHRRLVAQRCSWTDAIAVGKHEACVLPSDT